MTSLRTPLLQKGLAHVWPKASFTQAPATIRVDGGVVWCSGSFGFLR